MKLKPWYYVVQPRADLQAHRAVDASEFAVHLDEVALGRGPAEYCRPDQFFARTFLTGNLLDFAAEVTRRLAGINVATSACFSMTTQFGGGKTHALTLLYHLAANGPEAAQWTGVDRILKRAGLSDLPKAKIAVFVGQRFDPRGGDDGAPLRRTPWGEIAWRLGGKEGHELMAEFDQQGNAPGGDTLARLFDLVNQPVLILMDEVINYISRYRSSGLGTQFYNFLQNLTEEARARERVVVAISLPRSVGEMSADDEADYRRIAHLLDRLSKSVIMSVESDAGEIIRRRLFDWGPEYFNGEGRISIASNRDASDACQAYVNWLQEHRSLLPTWFPLDNARNEFAATYPFHPALISVFERKWQSLPSFQRTRGVLRMLALWVANAYHEGYHRRRGAGDLLLTMGSAPFDDPIFRQDIFSQLGERNLETPVTTDIFGSRNAHAARLDEEASNEAIKQMQLHRKVATAIFFESNGGQSLSKAQASLPEIRLAVGQPGLDIGNVETVIEALAPPDGLCYYLDGQQNRYWFSMRPNLTRLLARRKEEVTQADAGELVREVVQQEFGRQSSHKPIYFPERSNDIPNAPALTFVVVAPEQSMRDGPATLAMIDRYTREYGASARTFKNALVWAVADDSTPLYEAARKVRAWEEIDRDRDELQLSPDQKGQIEGHLLRAQGELRETVWRVYHLVVLLNKDNTLRQLDLGRHNSSAATSLTELVERELRKYDDIVDGISPTFLVRNWPAFKEWSVKAIRDAFFAAPQFPRITDDQVVREAVARGVTNGILAVVSKLTDGAYVSFYFQTPFPAADVMISDDVFVITAESAEAYWRSQAQTQSTASSVAGSPGEKTSQSLNDGRGSYGPDTTPTLSEPTDSTKPLSTEATATASSSRQTVTTTPRQSLEWTGELPHQKWMNFYMKVLTRFAGQHDIHIRLNVEISAPSGVSTQKIAEMQAALRELGLDDKLE
ncbi:MAG: AAA family ATPase [Chloroflexi bacterium]|nr:MAG: AAA family ATPase [Chloroflexota bacterium]